MNPIHPRNLLAVSALALLLPLAGCDRTDNRSVGQKLDAALARSDAVAQRAKAEAQGAAGDTEEAARKAAQATRTAGASGAVEFKDASARAAALTTQAAAAAEVAARKFAEQLDDVTIAAKVTTGIAADKNLSALRIKVESRDGAVTLKGPAPTAQARARAEEIARNVKGVTTVNNQLTVQAG